MHNYRELKVWQRSRLFVHDVYKKSGTFPNEERFGITSQLRRAVVSIPSNIAEGAGRNSDPDFSRFLDMALGSAYEVETLLLLCVDLSYLDEMKYKVLQNELNEIQRMINSLNQRMRGN